MHSDSPVQAILGLSSDPVQSDTKEPLINNFENYQGKLFLAQIQGYRFFSLHTHDSDLSYQNHRLKNYECAGLFGRVGWF